MVDPPSISLDKECYYRRFSSKNDIHLIPSSVESSIGGTCPRVDLIWDSNIPSNMYCASLFPVFFALLSSYASLAAPLPSGCSCNESPLSARSLDYIRQVAKARQLTSDECAFLCNPSHYPHQDIASAKSDTSFADPVNSPPLYDPAAPRPLPLFDGPPSTKNSDHVGARPISVAGVRGSASYASTKSTLAPPTRSTLYSYMLRVTGSVVLLLVMAICVVEVGDMAWIAVRRSAKGS